MIQPVTVDPGPRTSRGEDESGQGRRTRCSEDVRVTPQAAVPPPRGERGRAVDAKPVLDQDGALASSGPGRPGCCRVTSGAPAHCGLVATPVGLGDAGDARLHPPGCGGPARAAIRRGGWMHVNKVTGVPERLSGWIAISVDQPAQGRGHRLPEGLEVIAASRTRPSRCQPRRREPVP